jgi:hypothetical protein
MEELVHVGDARYAQPRSAMVERNLWTNVGPVDNAFASLDEAGLPSLQRPPIHEAARPVMKEIRDVDEYRGQR